MRKGLKNLTVMVLILSMALSLLPMKAFAAEDDEVYYDVERAVGAFRKMAKQWPSEITIKVSTETLDELCEISGFDPWNEFRQQFVTNMSLKPKDTLWVYGVSASDNSHKGGTCSQKEDYYQLTYYCALTEEQIAETQEAAEELVDELQLDDCISDFEKIKTVYDWFTHEVSYKTDNMLYAQTPYGALVKREAVCAGIGIGIEMVLSLVDVECRYISGFGTENDKSYHGWNLVKLGDQYYGLDAAFDMNQDRYNKSVVLKLHF